MKLIVDLRHGMDFSEIGKLEEGLCEWGRSLGLGLGRQMRKGEGELQVEEGAHANSWRCESV